MLSLISKVLRIALRKSQSRIHPISGITGFSPSPYATGFVILALMATIYWLWVCVCIFPILPWNEIRLEPSFLWANSLPVYPGQDSGAVTTWIYGPVPVILLWPATLATNVAGALLIGAAINLIFTAGAIGLVCASWPARIPWQARGFVGALSVMLWPASQFQFIQPDNFALAFGLMSSLLLVRAARPPGAVIGWVVAFCAATACFCKQTSVGLVAAQCLWLGWHYGRQTAAIHALRTATALAAFALTILGWGNVHDIWFNVIEVPAHQPWIGREWPERLFIYLPELCLQVAIPVIGLFFARRKPWVSDDRLVLPILCWLCMLPLGLAGLFKNGGAINSMQSWQLLLTPALLTLAEKLHPPPGSAFYKCPALLGAVAFLLCFTLRFHQTPFRPLTPVTRHLQTAESLAKQLVGHAWFPWNPLVTYYAEDHFYHVEDGLFARFLAGTPLSVAQGKRYLPPHWDFTILPAHFPHWGIAKGMAPAKSMATTAGLWEIQSWNTASGTP